MALQTLAICFLIPPLIYIYTMSVISTRFPMLRNKKICLLIAHPDDEAMFFSPTLLALTEPSTGNHVKILCLSSGDAEGLGETRKRELVKSGMKLGLRREEDIYVHEDKSKFPDSMTTPWSGSDVSALLDSAFAPSSASRSSDSPPAVNIDVLVSFDPTGVSGHINHRSLYHGACQWLSSLQRTGHSSPVALYTLGSVNIVRKYSMFFDIVATLVEFGFQCGWSREVNRVNTSKNKGSSVRGEAVSGRREFPERLVLASGLGPGGWGKAWKAMTEAHKSQMLWFRYGWIILSRYMVVNDLALVSPSRAARAGPVCGGGRKEAVFELTTKVVEGEKDQ
ncbi:N-acetylglucosaminyl-phosphatidylinositol de-N-acetylase [Zalerion maritima]|uniref:N-acetylglucosaminylphosphatidylinositol deacetylase n=1 Tax=Zalerion maritima TaxID=339359 RepID=A0AAD5RT95_9PEZI|nr:N-acetylglucosaminyl-phosphatidylinositol de-N-acetylase [Zalerion maritima]